MLVHGSHSAPGQPLSCSGSGLLVFLPRLASVKLVCVALEGQILEKQQLLEGLPALDTIVMEGIPPLPFLVPEEQPQGRTAQGVSCGLVELLCGERSACNLFAQ